MLNKRIVQALCSSEKFSVSQAAPAFAVPVEAEEAVPSRVLLLRCFALTGRLCMQPDDCISLPSAVWSQQ